MSFNRTRVAAVAALTLAVLAVASPALADPPPSLRVTSAGTPTLVQSQNATISFAVADTGDDTAPGDMVSVHLTAPSGLTLVGLREQADPMMAATWQCAAKSASEGTCTNTRPLTAGWSPAIEATFVVASDETSGAVAVTLASTDSSDDVVAASTLPFTIAPPYTLVISSPAIAGPTTAPAILGPVTVVVKDAAGNTRSVDQATTVSLSSTSLGGAFATTAGGAPVTALTLPAGSASATFFYGDTLPGLPRLIASAPGLFAAGQVETVSLGPAAQLAFTTAPESGAASGVATMGPIAVQVQDAYGNPVTVPAVTTVHLSSSSAHGSFAAKRGGAAVTSVSVAAGSGSASFWYADTAGGTPTLLATTDGLQGGMQTEALTGGPGVGASSVLATPTLTLTVSPGSPLRYRSRTKRVTLTARAGGSRGVPTGSVTFRVGSRTLCAHRALHAGVASCRVRVALGIGAAGRHVLTAVYPGSSAYAARLATRHVRVVRVR